MRWEDLEPEDLLPPEETEEVEEVKPEEAEAQDDLVLQRAGW